MSKIDPTARVEDGAILGDDVVVGPFCCVGSNVRIGAGTQLVSHVVIAGHTTIGAGCVIHPFASVGSPPQDLSYRAEPTTLEIGDGCVLREYVTMNVGTAKGGGATRVGKRGFFMNNAHVGHDCTVGDDVIFATSATLGGHSEVGDQVYIGGLSAVHQFTRIGKQAMIGGVTGVRADVIPYGFAMGQRAYLEGLNVVGMKRRKFTNARLHLVRSFYKDLFYGEALFVERLKAVQPRAADDPAIAEILGFIGDGTKRALCKPLPRPPAAD